MDYSFLDTYRDLAVSQYHVDPVVFIILYLVTIPTFYFGIYEIGKSAFEYRSKERKKNARAQKDFTFGLLVAVASWLAPNVYVILYGENIPTIFWVFLCVVVLCSGYLTYKKISTSFRK